MTCSFWLAGSVSWLWLWDTLVGNCQLITGRSSSKASLHAVKCKGKCNKKMAGQLAVAKSKFLPKRLEGMKEHLYDWS